MAGLSARAVAARQSDDFGARLRQVTVAAVLGVLLLLTLLWMLERLRGLLVLVVFSLFLAFAIEPVVNRLAQRGWRRGSATLLVYLGILIIFGGLTALLGTIIVRQVGDLISSLPDYANRVAAFLEDNFGIELNQDDVAGVAGSASQVGGAVARNALGFGTTLVALLFQLLLVATLTYYFAKDGPRMRRALCSVMPPAQQREVLRALEIAIDRTAGYVYFRAGLATLSAAAHTLAFWAMGVPFTVTLGLWVGIVSQFIPAVGTYLAGLLPLAVALAQGPRTALLVLVFLLIYQQIENYVLSPPLSARTMAIHPAVGLFAAVAGLALLGPLGALLAMPVVATVQAFATTYVVTHDVVEDELLED